jgi:hypothetical protein
MGARSMSRLEGKGTGLNLNGWTVATRGIGLEFRRNAR